MNFITVDYFRDNLSLPQKGNKFQVEELTYAISKHEPVILIDLLGEELYSLVQKAWDDLHAEIPVPLDTRMSELINGAVFQFEIENNIIKRNWMGLVNEIEVSFIANYVYYKYLTYKESLTSTTGEVVPKKENSVSVISSNKVEAAWNNMINIYGYTPKPTILGRTMSNVNLYFLDKDNYEHYNALSSAYNFLLAKKNVYPEWVFTPHYKRYFI